MAMRKLLMSLEGPLPMRIGGMIVTIIKRIEKKMVEGGAGRRIKGKHGVMGMAATRVGKILTREIVGVVVVVKAAMMGMGEEEMIGRGGAVTHPVLAPTRRLLALLRDLGVLPEDEMADRAVGRITMMMAMTDEKKIPDTTIAVEIPVVIMDGMRKKNPQ